MQEEFFPSDDLWSEDTLMTNWFKAFNGMAYDIKLRLVAHSVHVKVDKVFCIWFSVLDYASANEDRGSVEGFDPATCKVAFGYKVELVEKVLDEFMFRGMITEDNRIANWNLMESGSADENFFEEKETKIERAKRKNRERQKSFRDSTSAQEANILTSIPEEDSSDSVTHNAPRNAVSNADSNADSNGASVTQQTATDPEAILQPKDPNKAKSKSAASKEEEPLFPKVWEAWFAKYPRREAKKPAIKAWNKAVLAGVLPELPVLLEALEWQIKFNNWGSHNRAYTPLPATYINGRRWQDEKPAMPTGQPIQQPRPSYGYEKPDYVQKNLETTKRVLEKLFPKEAQSTGTFPGDILDVDFSSQKQIAQ